MTLPPKEESKTERKRIFADRKRTNILRTSEQHLIHVLLQILPNFITPNILTGIGLFGSALVGLSFILAVSYNSYFLLLGIGGLTINWFGDSLDGRLAYFRKIPRKWYGFALDIIMDWLSIILIGLGFYFYTTEASKVLAFLFVVLYGWSMLIALLRYKIVNVYQIDSGIVGPTELRVIIAVILFFEIFFSGVIVYASIVTSIVLLAINILDTRKLLKLGDQRDAEEKIK